MFNSRKSNISNQLSYKEKVREKKHRDESRLKKYDEITKMIDNSELALIVLDSRFPNSSRFSLFEKQYAGKILLVLNKIDLIPRENVIGWINTLKNISPVVAVSAINDISPIQEYIDNNNIKNVCVTGITNVGKKTIYNKINVVNKVLTEKWEFLEQSYFFKLFCIKDDEIVSRSVLRDSFIQFLCNLSVDSFRDFFKIDYDPIYVISNPYIYDHIKNGMFPFYSPSPSKGCLLGSANNLSEVQRKALKYSKILDSFNTPFLVHVACKLPNQMSRGFCESLLARNNT